MEQKTLFSEFEVEVKKIEIGGKEFLGLKIEFEGAPLLIIKGKRMLLSCAYLNHVALERMGNAACIVSGVRSFEDLLNAEIKIFTSKALEMGVKPGMKGVNALLLD
jgi:uncharacterized protein YunC (DUF1805 family)